MKEGDTVGSFILGPLLGRGGMASVHRASHVSDGTQVAIKILQPDIAAQDNFIEAFSHEVRAAAALNHHRITAIYDHGVVTGDGSSKDCKHGWLEANPCATKRGPSGVCDPSVGRVLRLYGMAVMTIALTNGRREWSFLAGDPRCPQRPTGCRPHPHRSERLL